MSIQNDSLLPSKKKSKHRFLLIAAVAGVVLVAGGFVTFLVPVFGQTLAARSMDNLGQHKLAMQLDALRQNPTMAALSSVDPSNPESCGQLWNYADLLRAGRLEAFQLKSSISVQPAKMGYAEDFYFQSIVDTKVNLKGKQAMSSVDLDARINGDRLQTMMPRDRAQPDVNIVSGNYSLAANLLAYTDSYRGSFQISKFEVEGDGLDSQDGLNSWYNREYNLGALQNQGLQEITEVIMDASGWKLQDMISSETAKTLLTNYCKSIDKIEVQAPREIRLGNMESSATVRPVVVTPKSNAQEILADVTPEMVEALIQDDKLVEFLKSKYPAYNKLVLAIEKLDSDYKLGNLTEEEYKQQIQKAFDEARTEFDKEALKQDLGNALAINSSQVEVIQLPMEYYINLDNGYLVGVRMETILKPTAAALEGTPDSELKSMFQEGFRIVQEFYDIGFNQNVGEIPSPDGEIKPVEDFEADAKQTDFYRQLIELFPSLEAVEGTETAGNGSEDTTEPKYPNWRQY